MTAGPTLADARRVTREVFGHEDLHPGQAEAIEALLQGDDVLLVSATGSGKSLVYQVPGVLLDGITLVVSPLLALQQDQLDALPGDRRTVGARLSSAETDAQRRDALDRAVRGELEYLAVSPEQLANDEVRAELARLGPSLVAWGSRSCTPGSGPARSSTSRATASPCCSRTSATGPSTSGSWRTRGCSTPPPDSALRPVPGSDL